MPLERDGNGVNEPGDGLVYRPDAEVPVGGGVGAAGVGGWWLVPLAPVVGVGDEDELLIGGHELLDEHVQLVQGGRPKPAHYIRSAVFTTLHP